MRILLVLLVALTECAHLSMADDLNEFSITPTQATSIKAKLDEYDKGDLTLEDLGKNANSQIWHQMIGYYLQHTNDISVKAKLPIGRCFVVFHMYPEGLNLGNEYLEVYSNDWHGWRLVGYCDLEMGCTNKAIQAYLTAVKLGDQMSIETAAGIAGSSQNWEAVKTLVPKLFALMESAQTPHENKIHLASTLTAYAIMQNNKDAFIRALNGFSMKEIVQNPDLRKNITSGFELFSGKDIDEMRKSFNLSNGDRSDLKQVNGQLN